MPLRAAAAASTAAAVRDQAPENPGPRNSPNAASSSGAATMQAITNVSLRRLQEAAAVATSAQPPTSTPREKVTTPGGDVGVAARGKAKTPRDVTRPTWRGNINNNINLQRGGAAEPQAQGAKVNRSKNARSPVTTPRGSLKSEGAGSTSSSKRRVAANADRESTLAPIPPRKGPVHSTTAAAASAQGPLVRRRQVTSSEASGRVGASSWGLRGSGLQRKSQVGQRLEPSVLHEHYNDPMDKMEAMHAAQAYLQKGSAGAVAAPGAHSDEKEARGGSAMHVRKVPNTGLVATPPDLPQPCSKCGAQALSGLHGVPACVCSPPGAAHQARRSMRGGRSSSSTPQCAQRSSTKDTAFLQHHASPAAASKAAAGTAAGSHRFGPDEAGGRTFPEDKRTPRRPKSNLTPRKQGSGAPVDHHAPHSMRRGKIQIQSSARFAAGEEPRMEDDRSTEERGHGIQEWMLWTLGMENGDTTAAGPMPDGHDKKRKVAAWLHRNA